MNTAFTPSTDVKTEPDKTSILKGLLEKGGLALVPAFGYYLAFIHESGYCGMFGVPNSFIRPDLTTILVVTSGMVITAPMVGPIIESFIDWDDQSAEKPVQRVMRLYMPGVLLLIFIFSLTSLKVASFFLAVLVLMSIADILAAFFVPRESQVSFAHKLRGPFRLHEVPSNRYKRRTSPHKYGFIFALFLLCSFCVRIAGQGTAMNQTRFLVSSLHPNWIVVRIYGEKGIFAEINECKELTGKFHVSILDLNVIGSFETKELGKILSK